MSGADLAALARTEQALRERLATTVNDADRQGLRDEIVALFRAVDAAVTDSKQLKEKVRDLAEHWKRGDGREGAAPARGAQSARVDHLGASTFIEKGWSRLALGDAAGAEAALRRALELAPGSGEAEALLGWAQMEQGQFDAALLMFHNVLLREPQHALARASVGYVFLRKRMYGEAIEHLSRAIRLDNDPKATLYAHLYLGQVYFEREMYDDARLFFRRALAIGPNLLQACYELGRAHWFAGERDEARAAWREGAEANKFNPWGKRCAAVLAAVEAGQDPPRDG